MTLNLRSLVMKLFICTDHDLHWPVGCGSVVWAESYEEARDLLDAALENHGLRPYEWCPYTLEEMSMDKPRAYVVCDGNY